MRRAAIYYYVLSSEQFTALMQRDDLDPALRMSLKAAAFGLNYGISNVHCISSRLYLYLALPLRSNYP